MLLSNLESFFLHHQEQTHLLPQTPAESRFCQEPGCATRAWQPTDLAALHMQEDSKVVGHPFWPDQSSAAQLPGVPALRRVRAGRVHTRVAFGEKLGMQKPTTALGLLQPGRSQHLQCYRNQRSRKSAPEIVLSGGRKGWLRFPTPHLAAGAVVTNPACVPGSRERSEKA